MNFVAAVLIGVGAFFSVCNWLCLLSSLRRRRFVSPVFPAPSLLTTLGLALADSTRPYWWVGLLTDYTFFALLAAAPRLISEAWRLSSFTRQQLLVADDGPRHFTFSLHRRGHFLLRATFDAGVPCGQDRSIRSPSCTRCVCLRLPVRTRNIRGRAPPSAALMYADTALVPIEIDMPKARRAQALRQKPACPPSRTSPQARSGVAASCAVEALR